MVVRAAAFSGSRPWIKLAICLITMSARVYSEVAIVKDDDEWEVEAKDEAGIDGEAWHYLIRVSQFICTRIVVKYEPPREET